MPGFNQGFLVEKIQLPKLEKQIRLSDLSFEFFRTINSRKALKNAVKKGLVEVDGQRGYTADYIIGGEEISIFQDENQKPVVEINLDIEVYYEDDYLAVVNKPAGMIVSGNKKWTLEHALPKNLKKSTQSDAVSPEPIHRLDYPTSGVLLVGKTKSIVLKLNKLFEERKIKKVYHAICIGKFPQNGLIEFDVDDKPSKSEYKLLRSVVSPKYEFLNLIELQPSTGRRHQLRKHLYAIGNPILGDLIYAKEGLILKGKGLYLHASSLEFVHPISGENLKIESKLPKKFLKIFP